MYYLYNPNGGEHFYTTGKDEHESQVKLGWWNESYAWYGVASGKLPEMHAHASVADIVKDGV